MEERFSIVIPVKNRSGLILRALDSIQAETYRPLDIIVVDNGSSDDTCHSVEEWRGDNCNENFTLTLLEEETPGACAARNRGLEAVRTDWMLFFDSDDEMNTGLIERLMSVARYDPDVEMIYWRSVVKGLDGSERLKKYSTSDHWHSHIYNAQFCTQCYAAKTDLFRRIGGWNEALPVWNDWEIGIRLLLANPKRVGIDEVLTIIYAQQKSITGLNFYSKAGEWERSIDEAERVVSNAQMDHNLKDKLLDMINYRRVNLAALYRKEGHPEFALPLEKRAAERKMGALKWTWLRILEKYTEAGGRGAYKFWR